MGTSPRGLCCWVQDIGYKFKCQTKNARVTINDNLAMFSLVKVILKCSFTALQYHPSHFESSLSSV